MGSLLRISARGRDRSGQTLRADVRSSLVRIAGFGQRHRSARQAVRLGLSGSTARQHNRGPVRAVALGAPQSKWRLRCRRAHVSSWFWPWFPQWLLVPRRPSRPRSRWLWKSPTPASSNNSARACLPAHGGPVLTHGGSAVARVANSSRDSAEFCLSPCAWLGRWLMRPADCHDRRQDRC